jgi:glutamate dehydrogenase (NAD(P)+)
MHDPLQLMDEWGAGEGRISTKMRQNAVTVLTEARNVNLTTHAAARELAQDRVRTAMILRGRIPAHGR